jgi:hypothetical protein
MLAVVGVKNQGSPEKSLLATNERLQLAFIKQKSGIPSKRGSVKASRAKLRDDGEEDMQQESLNIRFVC